ncbi:MULTISPECIES: ABC transporter substrate-binding protein [Pseudonocardia]|uniref:Glutathione-binding protein GsiB n=2 Tax=Pseudonocardia TaxID=1847 RepID=A0A1Y2ML19_PSEAH|nr:MULTISPECIES: ABC transporter substrate-binding protein [Pseudonocardia]OSY35731.1 Glutathione-binding protein GsiB precursor [Pseudonocardia autotrophica]TDN74577.1 peptide/nickel transport system substrate-binding protein [Pseudonocardia autotrophica]BBG05345.1 ABC transporter substrate-binding protein [Pseudonocardia autotrophica]GEC27469.1 ABC transporter substrate-binding protein [Pseudonocardia saturnea]
MCRALGLLTVSALIVAGCGGGGGATEPGGGEHDPNAVFKYAVPGMPTSFDPRQAAPLDPVFLDVVYESLIGRTPAGDIEPGLATEWELSDDNRVLDLTLREGVTFTDGAPFDSAAVVTSLEAFRESGAQKTVLAPLQTVEATGPNSVRLTFDAPSGYMVNALAGEAGIVVSPQAIDDPDLGTKPVGTGPFALTGLQQGKVTFSKNEDYWNAAETSIAGIEMLVFSDEPTRLRSVVSGETDGTTISAGQIREAEANGLSVVKGPNSTLNGILLNTGQPEFADPKVREALVYAIDREAVNDSLFAGECTPSVQPFGPGFWANVPELNDISRFHDPARSKALLAEAGYPDGVAIELAHGPNTTYQNLSQALQAQLTEAGFRADVRPLEFSQMVEARRTGNFSATVSLLQAGRPDSSQFAVDFYMPGGTYNPGNFSLPGLDALLAESRAADDTAEREGPTRELFREVFEAGPPVIPVCNVIWVAAFRDGVTGFEVPTYGDYGFASIKIAG